MSFAWKRIMMGAVAVGAVAAAGFFLTPRVNAVAAAADPSAARVGYTGMMSGMMGSGGMMGGSGMMNGNMGGMHTAMTNMHQQVLAATAGALGMSTDELTQALDSGKTLADLAKEQNVDPAKISEAIRAAHKSALDELVKAGTLTQAQADQMQQYMDDIDISTMFDGGSMHGNGSGGCHSGSTSETKA